MQCILYNSFLRQVSEENFPQKVKTTLSSLHSYTHQYQRIKDLLKIPVGGLTTLLLESITVVHKVKQSNYKRVINLLQYSRQNQERSREKISTGKYSDILDPDDKLNLSTCQVLQSTQEHIQMSKDIKSPHKPR